MNRFHAFLLATLALCASADVALASEFAMVCRFEKIDVIGPDTHSVPFRKDLQIAIDTKKGTMASLTKGIVIETTLHKSNIIMSKVTLSGGAKWPFGESVKPVSLGYYIQEESVALLAQLKTGLASTTVHCSKS